MPEWILADPHGGANADADAALLALLDAAADARADLLLLGDLFSAWIALDRFLTPLQRAVVDRLARVRAAGGRVRFVVGNRDYLVREGQLGKAFDEVIERRALLELGGVPTLVAHGDRENPDDHLYRAWHALTRSRPVTAALSAMPGFVGRRVAARVEAALRPTNAAYKTGSLPIDALNALGREAKALGASRVLVGHFHHDRTLDVPGGVPVVVAPAWLEHRRVLVVGEGGVLASTPIPSG